jgi:hypothetical protein
MEPALKRLICIAVSIFIFVTAITCFALDAGKEVKLAAADKKAMNTFFSNFSEAFVKPFTKTGLADSDLIQFGVSHNYINKKKLFAKTGKENLVKIKAAHIDEAVSKYFGVTVKNHKSVEGIVYKDGWYFMTEASGEAFIFSQTLNLYDIGNNMFTSSVNVYTASSGWTGNVHGSQKEWKKGADNDAPELSAVMKATLRKVTENGKSRYILIEYAKLK